MVISLRLIRSVRYENDADTFWGFCFCLFRDRDQGQVYDEEETLLCSGDIHHCVFDNHGFGLYRGKSLILQIVT